MPGLELPTELYLKALIVALTSSHPYTHDLTELATYPAFKGEVCQASNIKY